MQVKKFEAPTLQEALENVKRELGPEAIILQTRQNKKAFGLLSKNSVEITAAVSDRSLEKKANVDSRISPQSAAAVANMGASKQADVYDKYMNRRLKEKAMSMEDEVILNGKKTLITKRQYIDIEEGTADVGKAVYRPTQTVSPQTPQPVAPRTPSHLEEELVKLKRMVVDLQQVDRNSKDRNSSSRDPGLFDRHELQEAYESLLVNGVDPKLAFSIVKSVKQEVKDQSFLRSDVVAELVAGQVIDHTETIPLFNQPQGQARIALIGPTGVGKTTTLAKIASQSIIQRGMKVGFINVDAYKLGAFDQLATYAKILNVPFRSVECSKDLEMALAELSHLDLILIDTTGRSQRDSDSLATMKELIHSIPQVRVELVLSSTTRETEALEMGKRFSGFRPEGLIFSKLDESIVFGPIYNLSQKMKLPLIYFTTGQRVPEDLEEATKERMASLLVDLNESL